MSFGTDALAEDIAAIGQIADAALDAVYPGIQVQRQIGYWMVSLPSGSGMSTASGVGASFKDALILAQKGVSR